MFVVAGGDWRCFQQQREMGLKETNVGEPKHKSEGSRLKANVLLHSVGAYGRFSC